MWNLLGLMHQEGDEDEKAKYCFKNALKYDPNNTDVMLNLAVSYINDLMIQDFVDILKRFLQTDLRYKELANNVFTEGVKPTIDNLNSLISDSIAKNDKDVNLYIAKGLLSFAEYNFAKAAECFKSAVLLNSRSYSLWNKLGASYANSSNNDKAIVCYNMAISIRPNLTRSWVNLGISYYNKNISSTESLLPFLNGLSLNPSATHVWGYLSNFAFNCTNEDLKTKISSRKIDNFRDMYNIIDPNNLPAPNYSKIDESLAQILSE